MKLSLSKLAGSAVAAALLLGGASSAFALTYDTGSTASGSAGSIVPSANATTGATGTTGTTGATGTTGSSSTVTPGIPNTGAGGDSTANMLALGTSSLVAAGGAAYLARQKLAAK